ncbi:MAG: T9SS type A sorting domain-containing protein [Bacteroidales bacterium]|nr:T9SS type A sorting domain-containing protein [Bacteroidales bacterium]
MKKMFYVFSFSFLVLFSLNSFSQDTIAAWTFPSTSADSLIDISITANANRYISCEYGTYGAPTYFAIPIDYTSNGSLGSPDKCAKVVGLDNGADSVCFIVKFKTTGYNNLKLYSKQSGGGNNPGPRDFKVQYKLSGTSTWIDIPNGTVVCANDWTTGVLNGIDLPAACFDQSSNVSVRWLQTSNTDINGGTVTAAGISKIDDIIVIGDLMTGVNNLNNNDLLNVFPNPSSGDFHIENSGAINDIKIFNVLGKCVYNNEQVNEELINITGFEKGIYFVQFTKFDNSSSTVKLIVK